MQQQLQDIIDRIPSHNRHVLSYVVRLICDVADNEHENRMSVSALAVIFAPSFLRDPAGDPMVMMRDSKHAAQFVVHLATTNLDIASSVLLVCH